MKSFLATTSIFLALACVHADEPTTPGSCWTLEASSGGVTISSRSHEGSSEKEFKGVGKIAASPDAVFAVLDDTESYETFMPYTAEVRVIKREKDSLVAYQRLDFPFVSDRDYTLRSHHEHWLRPEGSVYRIRWEPANNLGPAAQPGVTRVNVCEGGWLLEPENDGNTRATYSIYTDSGGGVPAFLTHKASRVAIRKIFEAVRKQVRNPKYSAAAQ